MVINTYVFRFFKHLNENDKLKIDPFNFSLYDIKVLSVAGIVNLT